MNAHTPLTNDTAQSMITKLSTLSRDDTVTFEASSDSRDIGTIPVWRVDENPGKVHVYFSNPDSTDVKDPSDVVEYLYVTLDDDGQQGKPAARLEQYNGYEATHIGDITDITISDTGDATVTWNPY